MHPCLPLLVLAVSVTAQRPDTLAEAHLSAYRDIPVLRPSEDIRLDAVPAAANMQLADAVSRFTGVQVKDYGGLGGLKTINIRSLGSEHTGVFLDGIQIDNAQNMQVDLGRLSADNLAAVALFNAHKGLRLQTAKEYAAGATLHLYSEAPAADRFLVRLRGGSFGTVNPLIDWGKRFGRMSMRTSAEFVASRGDYKYPYFDTTLVRENGDIRSLRLESQLFGRLDGGSWRLRLYGYGSERGFPGPVIRRASGFPFSAERQADQDMFAQFAWEQDWTPVYSSALRLKYANNYTHYATHPEKNPMALPYDLHYRQQSAYLSFAQCLALSDGWAVDIATDLQGNSLDTDIGQNVSPRRLCFTGALATRYAVEKLRLAAHVAYMGAYDNYALQRAGGWSREDSWRDAWMPSVSAAWTPSDWLELDAFVKRSFRLPSFNDLYYSLMGNSALRPESAMQTGVDLHLRHSVGKWSFDGRISPYYNRVDDKIVAIPTASQFRWTMLNIGLADIIGLDMKTGASCVVGDFKGSLVLRYTYQRAIDHSDPESLTYGNQLPYIPRHSGSADLSLEWRRWMFAWNTQLVGEKWSRSANTDDYRIEPWSVSDAVLSRTFDFGGRLPSLAASIRLANIFDHRYQIVQGYPMPGRSVLAGIDISF